MLSHRGPTTQAVSPRSGRIGFTPLHAACEIGDGAAAGALLALGVSLEGPRGTPSPLALCLGRADQSTSLKLLAAADDATAHARLLSLATADTAHCALALVNATAAEHPAAADELVRCPPSPSSSERLHAHRMAQRVSHRMHTTRTHTARVPQAHRTCHTHTHHTHTHTHRAWQVRFLLDEEAAVAALTFSQRPTDPAAEACLALTHAHMGMGWRAGCTGLQPGHTGLQPGYTGLQPGHNRL